jgi:hypothetical protein
MSEQTPESSPRVWIQYQSEDTGEVALPGYLNATPSYLTPGTVFSVDREFLDELTQGGESDRFVEVDEPSSSPNAGRTKPELADRLGLDPAAYSKEELVRLADEYDRLHPEPPAFVPHTGDDGFIPSFDAAIAAGHDDAGDAADENQEPTA